MGIASLLLGENNPFAQWTNQNQNLLGAIGAGLGQGQNIQGGLAAGLAAAPQAKQLDLAASEKLKAEKLAENQANATQNWLQANHPDLAQMVQAGMPVSEAWSTAMQRMQPQGGGGDASSTAEGRQQLAQQYGLTGADAQMYVLTGKLPGANDSSKFGFTPIPVVNDAGEYQLLQPGSDGSTNTIQLPNGYHYAPGAVTADRAAGTAFGTAQGGVQFSLPSAKLNVEQELANIQALKTDTKGRNETFGTFEAIPGTGIGIPQQWLGAMGATDKFGYKQRVEQVVGQNFLQAFQSLKGAGAITEQEGAKAQAAMARLSTAQKQDDFDQALADLEEVLQAGYAVLQQKAATPFQSSTSAPAALTSGNRTSTGVNYTVEP